MIAALIQAPAWFYAAASDLWGSDLVWSLEQDAVVRLLHRVRHDRLLRAVLRPAGARTWAISSSSSTTCSRDRFARRSPVLSETQRWRSGSGLLDRRAWVDEQGEPLGLLPARAATRPTSATGSPSPSTSSTPRRPTRASMPGRLRRTTGARERTPPSRVFAPSSPSYASRAPASSTRATRNADGWSATSTTAPSNGTARHGAPAPPRPRRPLGRRAARRERARAPGSAAGTPRARTGHPPRRPDRQRARRRRPYTRPTRPSQSTSRSTRASAGISDHIETAAYFVVAEALANVAKYANATEAWVSVSRENGNAFVSVRDDGRGGPSQPAEPGYVASVTASAHSTGSSRSKAHPETALASPRSRSSRKRRFRRAMLVANRDYDSDDDDDDEDSRLAFRSSRIGSPRCWRLWSLMSSYAGRASLTSCRCSSSDLFVNACSTEARGIALPRCTERARSQERRRWTLRTISAGCSVPARVENRARWTAGKICKRSGQ